VCHRSVTIGATSHDHALRIVALQRKPRTHGSTTRQAALGSINCFRLKWQVRRLSPRLEKAHPSGAPKCKTKTIGSDGWLRLLRTSPSKTQWRQSAQAEISNPTSMGGRRANSHLRWYRTTPTRRVSPEV